MFSALAKRSATVPLSLIHISFGQIAAGQMEPAAYTGNMGTGLIDAYQFIKFRPTFGNRLFLCQFLRYLFYS